jgi:hypothetical protein
MYIYQVFLIEYHTETEVVCRNQVVHRNQVVCRNQDVYKYQLVYIYQVFCLRSAGRPVAELGASPGCNIMLLKAIKAENYF